MWRNEEKGNIPIKCIYLLARLVIVIFTTRSLLIFALNFLFISHRFNKDSRVTIEAGRRCTLLLKTRKLNKARMGDEMKEWRNRNEHATERQRGHAEHRFIFQNFHQCESQSRGISVPKFFEKFLN